jgi:hypothetical protein
MCNLQQHAAALELCLAVVHGWRSRTQLRPDNSTCPATLDPAVTSAGWCQRLGAAAPRDCDQTCAHGRGSPPHPSCWPSLVAIRQSSQPCTERCNAPRHPWVQGRLVRLAEAENLYTLTATVLQGSGKAAAGAPGAAAPLDPGPAGAADRKRCFLNAHQQLAAGLGTALDEALQHSCGARAACFPWQVMQFNPDL